MSQQGQLQYMITIPKPSDPLPYTGEEPIQQELEVDRNTGRIIDRRIHTIPSSPNISFGIGAMRHWRSA
jgi:hypothetical protein